jgi:apolipoprotein N-acyltransferase
MKKYHLILLSLLSGVLLSLAWPERGFPGLLFIAFVPLLIIENEIFRHPERFRRLPALLYSYPAFTTWNGLTTWWIYNSTGVGAIIAILVNALFMAIIFNIFHFSRKKLNNDFAAYAALVLYWILFEYLHLNWDLNWPWLNLGNAFGTYYKWVQWYEFTGALGGTLWVLVANILLFLAVGSRQSAVGSQQSAVGSQQSAVGSQQSAVGSQQSAVGSQQSSIVNRQSSIVNRHSASCLLSSVFFLWITIPVIFSYTIYSNYKEQPRPVKIVVVQPNIDPYSEQYVLPPMQVVGKIMELATPHLDSATNFLVAPESAIQEEMWENEINTFMSMRLLKAIIVKYPDINILVGGSTFRYFNKGEQITRTARQFTDTKGYYDAYNTAILCNSRDHLQLYHKSKLTPGVEILPSFKNFRWIEKFAINLGGTVGSLGTDEVRKVYSTVNTVPVSPAICYESVFGEFFSEFVKNGAQVMFIITNDGWWGNSPGHRQHFAFASLRAIENRRCIARSANTGISAFINQRGDISQRTKYWEPAVISGTVNANAKLTFYTRQGDYIARAALFPGLLLNFLSIIMHFTYRKKKK